MTHTMETAKARLDELALLEDGWLDGYGKKIATNDISNALLFLEKVGPEKFSIFPTETGGISLESISGDDPIALSIDFEESTEHHAELFIFRMDR